MCAVILVTAKRWHPGCPSDAGRANHRRLTGNDVPHLPDPARHDTPHDHDVHRDSPLLQCQGVAGLDDDQFRSDGRRRNRLDQAEMSR